MPYFCRDKIHSKIIPTKEKKLKKYLRPLPPHVKGQPFNRLKR
jgi:hypothetical protein